MARNYEALSDHDFELLIADLLGAEDGVVYEVFARGADLGVDLRHLSSSGPDVVQCKHYRGSTYAQLKGAVKAEVAKLVKLDPPPTRYRLVTTQSLTARRKSELAALLSGWVKSDGEILGAEDLEGLLNRHERVERAHVKLWLSSAAQLDAQLNSATWERSRQLHAEIKAWLPRYVQSNSYWLARTRLRKERVLVISGPPGIGKTTLARVLLADAAVDGYQPIEVSSDIEEAFKVVSDHEARAFYYDDFLGSTFLQDRLAKNEDRRLTSFMRRCAESKQNLLVLTTREHILQQAVSWYEELERGGLPLRRFLLELDSYTRLDRALIFYNHLWYSDQIDLSVRQGLLDKEAYLQIIDHRNYNPRLIEYITGWSTRELGAKEKANYVGFAVEILDTPERIWQRAFTNQLDDAGRALLICVATMPSETELDDLSSAFDAMAAASGVEVRGDLFRNALRVLDDTFTRSHERDGRIFVTVANPSVDDFVAAWLQQNVDEAVRAIAGVRFYEQLQWLSKRLDLNRTNLERIGDAIEEAIYRCWDSANPTWVEYLDGDSSQLYWSREYRSFIERLRFAFGLSRLVGSTESLISWIGERLLEVSAGWRQHIVSASEAVALIRSLRSFGFDVPRSAIDAAAYGLSKRNDHDAWSQMADLVELAPESFDDDFLRVTKQRCWHWVTEIYRDTSEVRDTDELFEIRHAARKMGVEVDEELFDNAWYEVSDRDSSPTSEPRGDSYMPASDGEMSAEDETQVIAALFVGLADPVQEE